MGKVFALTAVAGPHRDLAKGTREQPYWDEHAQFIDGLVAEGFILMAGPLVDEGGAMLVISADSEDEVKEKMQHDPWYTHGILKLQSIKRWEIFIDMRG